MVCGISDNYDEASSILAIGLGDGFFQEMTVIRFYYPLLPVDRGYRAIRDLPSDISRYDQSKESRIMLSGHAEDPCNTDSSNRESHGPRELQSRLGIFEASFAANFSPCFVARR